MELLEWLRFGVGTVLLVCGLVIFGIEMFGVFRFKYVLNRMHAAAMGDTLGIGFSLVGLMVMNGLNFTTLKLLLVVIFLWFSSPVSSHLIARLEVTTNPDVEKECPVYSLEELTAKKQAPLKQEPQSKPGADAREQEVQV